MLLASLLVYYAVGALNTVMLTRVQVRFGRYLSRRYMTGVLDREFPFFVNRSGGDLIYRANLVMVVEQIVTGSLPSTVVSMVFLVVYLIMMIAYSVPLTMLTLTVCAAVLVVSVIYSLRNRTLVERATVAQADVQRAFIETFSGIETVKSLNLESHCYDRWSARLGAQLDYQTRQGRFRHCCQACPRRWCSCCRYAWSLRHGPSWDAARSHWVPSSIHVIGVRIRHAILRHRRRHQPDHGVRHLYAQDLRDDSRR